MANKISNKQLLYLLVLFVAVIFVYKYMDVNRGTRSFPETVVSIDSSLVTEVSVFPKSTNYTQVKLMKQGTNWKVELRDGKTAEVPVEKIQNLFKELLGLKPERLAATTRSKWKEFQVDSLGTRVKVFQGNSQVADLVIGRLVFNQQTRSATSYFRVFNDSNVYAVNGFLEFAFNQGHNSWRDNTLLNINVNSVLQLNYVYPDSSFSLVKENNKWLSDEGQELDSALVGAYLSSLTNIRGSEFIDDIDPNQLVDPTYSLRIETFDAGTIILDAYVDSTQSVVVSNLNPTSCFDPVPGDLLKKLFVGKAKFQTAL